ncbi:MAG: ATP-binding protein [bacterium]
MIKRELYKSVWASISADKQMVFLSGPRQTGKTTFAREAAKSFANSLYFNWDVISHKRQLVENPYFFTELTRKDSSQPLVIFDEIHKYSDWKNYLKGVYDGHSSDYKFLVSGSGRLDLYQKRGDSLAGRYFHMHMFPFTMAELSKARRKFSAFARAPLADFNLNNSSATAGLLETLLRVSGFPEPFVKGKTEFWSRWSANYLKQVVMEDIRDLADLKKTDTVELLFSLLPSRVGGPVSINNLAADLRSNFDSVDRWLSLFDSFFLTFRISPWSAKISRSILKEKKTYLYDYPEIPDPAARLENLIAVELKRAVTTWTELGYGRFSLHYLRNKEKEEVDFLIADGNTPFLIAEVKLSDDSVSPSLLKFQNMLGVPAVQLVGKKGIFKYKENGKHRILVVSAHNWLSSLP